MSSLEAPVAADPLAGLAPTVNSVPSRKQPLASIPLEGVFAISKPRGITSADVLRNIQSHFSKSAMFKPWLTAEADKMSANQKANKQERSSRRQRRFSRRPEVKVGHGGTLDPLATGVLIVGIGSGTKTLSRFLGGSKSYVATVLFGAATDSYDSEGQVVALAPTSQLTAETVRSELGHFQGEIDQLPPIYSALKVKGKPMYEYARSGGEVPKLQPRKVTVYGVQLEKWFESGTHQWTDPKTSVDQACRPTTKVEALSEPKDENSDPIPAAHPTEESLADAAPVSTSGTAGSKRTYPDMVETGSNVDGPPTKRANVDISDNVGPAAQLSMTVSSGFYVRSLCHDVAKRLGSAGHMVALERSRQSEFDLTVPFPANLEDDVGEREAESADGPPVRLPVLPYDDLKAGEDVWAAKVGWCLRQWERIEETKSRSS